jgi:hypothetical protein
MTTNPPHILIARNSRGLSNVSASLSSPTETHAAAAGIFRSSAGSPPWFLGGVDTEDAVSELSTNDSHEPIDVDEAFTKRSKFPGSVKIIVESTTFWCVPLASVQLVISIADALLQGPQRGPLVCLSIFPGRSKWGLGGNWTTALAVLGHYDLPASHSPWR